jgi:predicted DNA-binding transcriptional regulator YafY
MGLYSRKVFGMFSGVERVVRLRMANHLIGAVLDRFGKDVMVIPDGPDYFTIQVSVEVSPQFFGRVSAFGADARILGPEDVVDQMRAHLRAVSAQYGEG